MKVKPVYRDEGQLWGFIVSILSRDGAVTTEIRVRQVSGKGLCYIHSHGH